MTAAEFRAQFQRLEDHFHKATSVDADQFYREWGHALGHYHVDALDLAVTHLIREAKDRHWPALGIVLEHIKSRIASMPRSERQCDRCHGTTWIDAWPMKDADSRVYEYMERCPDCGTPAPTGGAKAKGFVRLNETEHLIWKAGEWNHPPQPTWAHRKKERTTEEKAAHRRELYALFEVVRQKHFPHLPPYQVEEPVA